MLTAQEIANDSVSREEDIVSNSLYDVPMSKNVAHGGIKKEDAFDPENNTYENADVCGSPIYLSI